MEKKTLINNTKHIHTKLPFLLAFIGLLLVSFGVLPSKAQAASLYFIPSVKSYSVGDNFSVSVYVSSTDQSANAASGTIYFPTDKLKVNSLSKDGSIFNLWTQEPSFSNSQGTAQFEGVILNPGFIGSAGKIVSINFRALSAGQANMNFNSASVLANDGNGTNILTNTGTASFNLGGATIPQPVNGNTPSAPIISSSTHPDQNAWYSNNNPQFTWTLPQDATAVRLFFDRFPDTVPTITYVPAISSKEISNVADGAYYFHAQIKNNNGWGAVSHFKFQIDTQKPDHFDIKEITREDLTDPSASFTFDASDKTSGIDHYEIQINNNETKDTWKDDGSHIYKTPVLDPGKYTFIAKAVDKAGNFLVGYGEFTIEALESPVIIQWSKELQAGEKLVVKGTTKYPNTGIAIYVQKQGEDAKSQTTQSDGNGNFAFTSNEGLSEGAYKVWAQVVDARGAKSLPTDKLDVIVKNNLFSKISSFISFLTEISPLISLILLIILLLLVIYHLFNTLGKRKVKTDETSLQQAFDLLINVMREHIKIIEKISSRSQLTQEEERIIKKLKDDLDNAEKFAKKN